jgi:hypothetical protein
MEPDSIRRLACAKMRAVMYRCWSPEVILSRFGVSPAPALTAVRTTHLSELRLSRLALFTVTHLHKLSIASAIKLQFNPSILPAHHPPHIPIY